MLFEVFKLTDDEDVGTDANSYSALMRTLDVEFAEACASSYYYEYTAEPVEAKWFVTAKRNDAMFSLDSVRKAVPASDNGVFCRNYLDETKHNVVYFIDPTNPHEWFGFAAYSYEEHVGSSYSLHITLEMIYIKPEYRQQKLGYVTSYELGRLISEDAVYYSGKINKETRHIAVSSYSQGCNEGGAVCLRRFFEGLECHFCDVHVDDDWDELPIPCKLDLVDEY